MDNVLTREHRAIVEAIVHLNFNEADKALDILLDALSEYNFEQGKGISYGNTAA